MDKAVKAAILAVVGVVLFLVAIVALPRTVASVILDTDVVGEGALAAIAFGAVTIAIGAGAWFWGALVVRMLRADEAAELPKQLTNGANDDGLH